MRAENDSEKSWDAFDRAFDPLLNKRSRESDEALAALLSFYIGELAGEDLTCELIARGKHVLPYLKRFRNHEIKVDTPARRLPVEEKRWEYDDVISRIEAGDHCERER